VRARGAGLGPARGADSAARVKQPGGPRFGRGPWTARRPAPGRRVARAVEAGLAGGVGTGSGPPRARRGPLRARRLNRRPLTVAPSTPSSNAAADPRLPAPPCSRPVLAARRPRRPPPVRPVEDGRRAGAGVGAPAPARPSSKDAPHELGAPSPAPRDDFKGGRLTRRRAATHPRATASTNPHLCPALRGHARVAAPQHGAPKRRTSDLRGRARRPRPVASASIGRPRRARGAGAPALWPQLCCDGATATTWRPFPGRRAATNPGAPRSPQPLPAQRTQPLTSLRPAAFRNELTPFRAQRPPPMGARPLPPRLQDYTSRCPRPIRPAHAHHHTNCFAALSAGRTHLCRSCPRPPPPPGRRRAPPGPGPRGRRRRLS
jgi:hypothetical protein